VPFLKWPSSLVWELGAFGADLFLPLKQSASTAHEKF
jgi:hypothetical protein